MRNPPSAIISVRLVDGFILDVSARGIGALIR
jgi:hypothetical protein